MASVRSIINNFNTMKTLPHVAIRLSQLTSDENTTVRDLEELIKMDPMLVLRVLRMVNSPYYGLVQKVESIASAVVYIGIKNLRNMVFVEALKEVFREASPQEIFSRKQLWLHSAAVSICGQMISERIFEQKGEDAFLCGILHDVGMIVEDQVVSDAFLKACRAHADRAELITVHERENIGTDHCAVGGCLASDWKLPPAVQKGIRHHHRHLDDIDPSSIAGIIQVAEYMVTKMKYKAMPGMAAILSPPLVAHIQENLEEYKVLATDLPAEMTKAKDLYES